MDNPRQQILDEVDSLRERLRVRELRGRDFIEQTLELDPGGPLPEKARDSLDSWRRDLLRYEGLTRILALAGYVERYEYKLVPEDRGRAMLDPESKS